MSWANLGITREKKNELEELKLRRQKESGREVTFDEVIGDLLDQSSYSKEKDEKESLEDVFMRF